MKSLLLVGAALCAAIPALSAQDVVGQEPAGAEMPNPKTKEHELLKSLVGHWDSVMRMEAMPGVPGMEKATEAKGSEHTELICNGLYAKTVINGIHQGKPFEGIWIVGYDPFRKQYSGVWVSSDDQECGSCTMAGTYDSKVRTWEWRGSTPQGEMRSVIVCPDKDRSVETCYMTSPDGKEAKCAEITRTRAKAPAAVEATAKSPVELSKEYQLLHKDVGDWDATVTNSETPDEDKASERVTATCNGRWLWSDFRGEFGGMPFEGHALVGYDPKQKAYVSFWFDSMSAVFGKSAGSFDPDTNTYTLEGTSVDPTGKPITFKEVRTWKDDDTRVLQMDSRCGERTSKMEITYRRKTKD